uniref:Uncharacterized protein n=1 Tax=Anguilla anguilla TaxID=7936 RepID=A0A0E9RSX8_ANGAN
MSEKILSHGLSSYNWSLTLLIN